jgi:DNA-binding NarL/FixJ family response regulator
MMSQRGNGRIRTLVVEDNWLLRRATCRVLKREPDIQVVGIARDGATALDKINALQPDLVVTDLAMPDMGGLELAFLLRRRFPAMGIIVVGTVQEPEITDLCGLCGVDVLVNKALVPAQLPGVIRLIFSAGEQSQQPAGGAVASANSEALHEEIAYGPNW